jgi:dTDP-4-dehydrorhamnose reductase
MTIPDSWRILVTGITAIHGWPIYCRLREIVPAGRLLGIGPPKMKKKLSADSVSQMCMTDFDKLAQVRDEFQPTHIVHCAGVCDLDVCEVRPEWAHGINVRGARNLMEVFGADMYILYMSTDLVFSGDQPPKDGYTEDHLPDPVSVVGKTFVEAEAEVRNFRNHCIVRLGLPLGDSFHGDKGAVDWIESRFKKNLPVTLFHDELRSCVSCEDIGEMAVKLLVSESTGLYHFGGEKSWTLYEIGEYVLDKGYSPELLTGILRHQEKNGPPRIGDVSMDSTRLKSVVRACPSGSVKV